MGKFNKIILFDIDYTLFKTSILKESNLLRYELYDEVIPVLTELSKQFELGIFSEGNTEFQETKLKKTGIVHLFDIEHIHIAPRKDDLIHEIVRVYEGRKLIVVDDKLPVLFQLKKIMPSIKTVWIKRGFYAENQEPIVGFTTDRTIESLLELESSTFLK